MRPEPFAVEYRIRRHDGEWRTVIDRAVPVLDDAGEIESWIGTLTDVTEARQAEAEIERANARLRRIFEANVVGACIWRGDYLVDANDALLEMLGVTREQLQAGAVSWRALTPSKWDEVDERATAEMRESGSTTFEKSYSRADGSEVPVLIASALFSDSMTEGVALVIDLSERKERERFEQEFLAGVAHDLKNPLAAMRAQAQLMLRRLKAGRLTDDTAADGLEAIEQNVMRVANRLEELMDVALLRAGHGLQLKRDLVDLGALITRQAESYRQATDRHEIVVTMQARSLIGAWDTVRLERIVDNLLSNAIKYSPNGGVIRLTLSREMREGRPWAVLAVTDEGVGIPAADLPLIFHRLRRATNVLDRMHGAGIGLAGVHQLVELHGGTITAESEEGQGSRFTVRLPLSG
jgi:PAS domain S-box-containing protein